MQEVIVIEDLYKEYQLGTFGYGTLSQDMQSLWAKFRGNPDPNSIIGQKEPCIEQTSDRILALNNIQLIENVRNNRLYW